MVYSPSGKQRGPSKHQKAGNGPGIQRDGNQGKPETYHTANKNTTNIATPNVNKYKMQRTQMQVLGMTTCHKCVSCLLAFDQKHAVLVPCSTLTTLSNMNSLHLANQALA